MHKLGLLFHSESRVTLWQGTLHTTYTLLPMVQFLTTQLCLSLQLHMYFVYLMIDEQMANFVSFQKSVCGSFEFELYVFCV